MVLHCSKNLYTIDLSSVSEKNALDAEDAQIKEVVEHRLDRKNIITHLDMRIYNFVQVSKYLYTMSGSMKGKLDRSFLADENPELFTTYA